jgi:hypothetical protein
MSQSCAFSRQIAEKLLVRLKRKQTNKHFRLMAAFRKFCDRYNDLVYDYKIVWGQMLFGVFYTDRQADLGTLTQNT